MNSELIIIREYIQLTEIEPQFISLLEENGLIHIFEIDNEQYLHHDELVWVERYARMYYDLSINMEGIDVIHNLLEKICSMQEEMKQLKNQLSFPE
ncbi:chaperone modulator CbpM [Bacteroidales bacterium OttesenSCG-928-I14]|nr:chaperone modulator CbpM [Bacteroidales bacterium OttesenSCG-928-I14]